MISISGLYIMSIMFNHLAQFFKRESFESKLFVIIKYSYIFSCIQIIFYNIKATAIFLLCTF